jgi:hypothetical protein
MRNTLLMLSVGLAVTLGGCGELGYIFGHLFPPDVVEEIHAEFDGLPGSTIAVVVHVPDEVHYTHPTASLEISAIVSERLKMIGVDEKNPPTINTISPYKIDQLQREDLYWEAMPKTELAKKLGADYVLLVTVMEFSTREPGSQNLYRGQITAQCSLYDASTDEVASEVWNSSRMSSRFPQNGPFLYSEDDEQIRLDTIVILAEKLAKKFYDHDVPVGGRPKPEEEA